MVCFFSQKQEVVKLYFVQLSTLVSCYPNLIKMATVAYENKYLTNGHGFRIIIFRMSVLIF